MSQYFLHKGQKLYLENYNNDFLIIKRDQSTDPSLSNLGEKIYQAKFNFVEEVIATEQEILLKLNPHFNTLSVLKIEKLNSEESVLKRKIKLPVCFDEKVDWEIVCNYTGVTKKTYLQKLLSVDFKIAMFGFLPGFVYLKGLPKELYCPRKATPNKKIPAHSFAVGSQYAGIYSLPSPGGWNIIGQLATPIINLPQLPPNHLKVTDHIKVEPISIKKFNQLRESKQNILTYNGLN